ncbi:MAG: hypothetical protein ACRD47_07960, partial [Nitrososphaeraceae archaeon]
DPGNTAHHLFFILDPYCHVNVFSRLRKSSYLFNICSAGLPSPEAPSPEAPSPEAPVYSKFLQGYRKGLLRTILLSNNRPLNRQSEESV